jgi:flagella basal body P-ring formation protein FlgA
MPTIFLTAVLGAAGCIPIEHDRIGAGDLASVAAELRSLAPDITFGYAPQPGAVRLISAEEIRRFAAAHGLTLASAAEVCIEYPVRALDPVELVRSMQNSLGSGVRIEVVDFSRNGVPRGRLVFERSGLLLPAEPTPEPVMWRGHIEYALQKRVHIWARVRVTETRSDLVAARDLRPHEPIGSNDVRIETREAPLAKRLPVSDAASVEGMLPRRAIAAGTPIRLDWLQAPEVVRRGDQVPVVVVSSSAMLRLHARAESAARAGQRLTLTNPETGRRFEAVVDRRGEALVQVGEAK